MSKNKSVRKKSVRKIISMITTVLLTGAFLFALVSLCYVLIQGMQGKETSLFGYKLYYVESDSMSPTLEKGDMIISKVIKPDLDYVEIDTLINTGDVITFKQNVNGVIINNTHRVVRDVYYDAELKCHCVVTKGDNPTAPQDKPIPISDIRSKMVFETKSISNVYEFLGSTSGIAVVIVLPMGLLLVSTIYQLVLKLKKPTEEKDEPSTKVSPDLKAREEALKRQAIEEYLKQKAIEEYLEKQEKGNPNEEKGEPKN